MWRGREREREKEEREKKMVTGEENKNLKLFLLVWNMKRCLCETIVGLVGGKGGNGCLWLSLSFSLSLSLSLSLWTPTHTLTLSHQQNPVVIPIVTAAHSLTHKRTSFNISSHSPFTTRTHVFILPHSLWIAHTAHTRTRTLTRAHTHTFTHAQTHAHKHTHAQTHTHAASRAAKRCWPRISKASNSGTKRKQWTLKLRFPWASSAKKGTSPIKFYFPVKYLFASF